MVESADRVIEGKGATTYPIGLAATRIKGPVTDAELAGLRASADAVRGTARRFGL